MGGCVRQDEIDYFGYDTGSTSTSNEAECITACGNSDVCSFWTFNRVNHRCMFKSSNADQRYERIAVSGSKACAGILVSSPLCMPSQ